MVHLTKRQSNLVRHQGGCHCGAVRFEVLASPRLTVFECNCSICVKKQIKYFLVPFNQFKLVTGHHSLQTYSFNTHQAKYNFCGTCGVQPFHIPSSNPDAYGIAMHCLDEGTIKKVTYEKIDSKKEASAKQKVSAGDKTGTASLGVKAGEQPLRKTSFIAMINSWSHGQSSPGSTTKTTHSKPQSPATTPITEAKRVRSNKDSAITTAAHSTQDSAATDTITTRATQDSEATDTITIRATQDSEATETITTRATQDSEATESNSVRSSASPDIIGKAEGRSPQQPGHRRFIVTKVVERSPHSSPSL